MSIRDAIKWRLFPGINLNARQRWGALGARFATPKSPDVRWVLDAGCGNGMLAYRAYQRGNRVLGITIKEREVGACRRLFNEHLGIPEESLSFRLHNLYEVEDLGMAFDEIVCSEVLEHIERDADVCASFARILRPGGVLHLCAPNAEHPLNRDHALDHHECGGHVRAGYTLETYRVLLEDVGLRLTESAGLGGPIRQRWNRRITAAQERWGFGPGFLLYLVSLPFVAFDDDAPEIPYSLYVSAVKPAVASDAAGGPGR